MGKRAFLLLATVILLVGAVWRLGGLAPRSLWIDDFITRQTALLPIWKPGALNPAPPERPSTHSIASFTLHDTGPGPLTYVLEGLFARWAKPYGGEFWIRLPGVVGGIAALLIFLWLGPRWTGGRDGALMLGTLASLPMVIEWCTGARGYGWAVAIVVADLGLLVELSRPATRRRSPNLVWCLLLLLIIAGALLHPLMTVWNAAVVLGALVARNERGSCAAHLTRGGFWGGLAAVCLLNLIWFSMWYSNIRQMPQGALPPFSGDAFARAHAAFAHKVHSDNILGLAPPLYFLVPIMVGILFCRGRRFRPATAALLAGWILFLPVFLLLMHREFLQLRYFFVMVAGLIWAAASVWQRNCSFWRRRFGSWPVTVVAAIALMALLVAFNRTAWQAARRPIHDWGTAVKFLKERIGPTDMVFAGPNSDVEMLWEYGTAVGIPEMQIPRSFSVPNGSPVDAFSEAGLKLALQSNRRLWFVTPFWGQIRPASYWKLAEANFKEVVSVPGRMPIRVMVHEPVSQPK
ncbi:MAG: hypothetical protein K1X53_04585 [Candidatus Sumerlaeaceae bacterium]|nr:hypothetical protein [Candidatus Sumerlaeaceae bacterium]